MTDKTISKTFMFCSLLIFLVIIYLPTLNGGFYHDDRPNLVYNSNVQIDELTLDELITASTSSNAGTLKRPISMMSFALNYHFFGDGPTSFRITNLIIHFANSILIFFIAFNLRRLTNTSLPNEQVYWFAVAATFLWAIHPLHVSTVAYIVQRMTLLSTFFSLFAIYLFIKAKTKKNNLSLYLYLICGLSILFGIFSKENAILTIPMLALIDIIVFYKLGHSHINVNAVKKIYIILLTILIVGLFILWDSVTEYLQFWYSSIRDFTFSERVYTQFRVVLLYIKWFFYPNIQELGLFHDDIRLSKSLFDPISTLYSGVILFSLISFALLTYKKLPLSSLGLLWFFLAHMLESTVIPLEMLYEHRNYFPFLGLILVTLDLSAYVISKFGKIRNFQTHLTIAIIVIFSCVTVVRGLQWSTTIDFAYFEAQHHPNSPRANHLLGLEYMALVENDQPQYKLDAYHYLEKSSLLDSRYIHSETALFKLANRTNDPANPDWINRISYKLENKVFKRDSLLLLQDLLKCDDDQCLLPKDAGYLLLESLEKNQRLPLNSKLHSAVFGLKANFILDRNKNVVFAEELFRRAITIDPTVIQNYVDYSHLLALLGRNGEIDQVIDKALSMTNNNIDIDILEQLRILLTHL